jgi:hypothetical protein
LNVFGGAGLHLGERCGGEGVVAGPFTLRGRPLVAW